MEDRDRDQDQDLDLTLEIQQRGNSGLDMISHRRREMPMVHLNPIPARDLASFLQQRPHHTEHILPTHNLLRTNVFQRLDHLLT